MEQKFFFFDIDNTLAVWPDSTIPESAQYALDTLRAAGHRVALATGRIQMDAARFAKMAHVTDFVADGGHSLTVDNQLIFMEGLPKQECIAYLEQLEDKHIPWAITDRNDLRRITKYKEITEDWHPDWDVFKTIVDPDFDFHDVENFYKVYVFFKPGEEKEKNIIHMNENLIRYGEGCILFEPMNKAYGIKKMLEYFKVPLEQAVVFGDGYNDLSMFQDPWLKIAMGNAREPLKEAADYITTACDEDGILKACQHFGWVK